MTKSAAEIKHAALKNGTILGIFAFVSTGLIVLTHFMTKETIAQEIEASMARRLNEIIPNKYYDNDVYHDCLFITDEEHLGTEKPLTAYRMRKANNDYAIILSSIAPNGYAGTINLITGVYRDGKVAGVRVTKHQETPGLGDKIEIKKSDWIKQFDNKVLENPMEKPWKVKKDDGEFDALTGATVTSRAIVKAVYNTLKYYQLNSQALFDHERTCGKAK